MTIKLTPHAGGDVSKARDLLMAHGWSMLLLHFSDGSVLMSDDQIQERKHDGTKTIGELMCEVAELREALAHYQNHPPPHPCVPAEKKEGE